MSNAQFSADGLQRLHRAMAGFVESGERPGIVTLVDKNGETHVDAVGTHETGTHETGTHEVVGDAVGATPMRRDSIFRIASVTKMIAGAATMMLVEEGRLALDEPIDRLIPELANRRVLKRLDGPIDDTVPAKRPILVSDLLTLRMGIGAIMTPGDYPINAVMMGTGVFTPFRMPTTATPEEWLAKLAALPLMNHPGETWRYDTGITVLGALISRAAGKPLEEALAERLFDPLGMIDTGFMVPADKLHRLPPCYQKNHQTGRLEIFDPAGPESFFARMPGFPAAHGGLVSTADDLLAFARMIMNEGRVGDRQLLSKKSVEAMTRDHILAEVKARSPFGSGFWEKRGWGYGGSTVKSPSPGEPRGFGWDGGYGISCYWDRQSGVVGALLTQRLMDSPTYPEVFQKFWDGAYAAAGV